MRFAARLVTSAVIALPLGAGVVLPPASAVERREIEDLRPWFRAVEDPARADSAFAALGDLALTLATPGRRAFAHYLRFLAARSLERPDTMRAEADSAMANAPDNPTPLMELGEFLLRRRMRLDEAQAALERGIGVRSDAEFERMLPQPLTWLGRVRALRGDDAGAVTAFQRALRHYDQGDPLLCSLLAASYARLGRRDDAIAEYERALSFYPPDTTIVADSRAELEALLAARGDARPDAEARLAKLTADAQTAALVERRRDERPAPPIRLHSLRAGRVEALDLSHGTTVVDFWGLWCRPCVEAMPGLQKIAEKYGARGVRFATIHVGPEGDARERRRILEFLDGKGVSLATFEADSATVANWNVEAYPTTFVVHDGRVRFRNTEFSEASLEAQIADLRRRAGSRR